jgi:hypothetical protein
VKVILIIGIVLGTIGSLLQIFTVAFGDTILATINKSKSQLPANLAQVQENLKKAADKSFSHVLYIIGDLAVIIAGGVFGLIAASSDSKRLWKTIFSCATITVGLGLLAFRNWVCAVVYILGGFLLIIFNEKEQQAIEGGKEILKNVLQYKLKKVSSNKNR